MVISQACATDPCPLSRQICQSNLVTASQRVADARCSRRQQTDTVNPSPKPLPSGCLFVPGQLHRLCLLSPVSRLLFPQHHHQPESILVTERHIEVQVTIYTHHLRRQTAQQQQQPTPAAMPAASGAAGQAGRKKLGCALVPQICYINDRTAAAATTARWATTKATKRQKRCGASDSMSC